MTTFNHEAVCVFDAIGTTKHQVIDYLKNLKNIDGQRPKTAYEAAKIIIEDIRCGSPEAIGVLSQVFTEQMLDVLANQDTILSLLLSTVIRTAKKPSYLLEEIVTNMDEYEKMVNILLIIFLSSISNNNKEIN